MKCVVWLAVFHGLVHLCSSATAQSCIPRSTKGMVEKTSFYSNITVDVVLSLRWSKITVIYETVSDSTVDINFITHKLHLQGISTMLLEYNTTRSPGTLTSMIADVTLRNTSSPDVNCFLLLGDNKFVLHTFREMSQLVTLTRSNLQASTLNVTQRHLSAMTTEWLTLVDLIDLDPLNDVLRDWDHVVVINTSPSHAAAVWTLQRSGDSTQLSYVTSVGTPTPSLSRHRLLPNLSQGLSGRTLRVVVREAAILATKVTNGTTQWYEGALIDLLEELSLQLNFSYTLHAAPENVFGQRLDNGQWNGAIGMLTRQEADLALALFRVTQERLAVVDSTEPYNYDTNILVVKTPGSAISDDDNFFLRPFHTEVYVLIFGSGIFVLLLLLLSRFCHWYAQGSEGTKPEVTQWLIADGEAVVAGLLNKPHDTNLPPSRTGHVVLISWLSVSIIMMASLYSSQLTATLAIRDVTLPFTSLEELVNQKTYTWGMKSGTAMQSRMKYSHDNVYRKFYEGVVRFSQSDPDVLSPVPEVHLQKILTSKYVFIMGTEHDFLEWQASHCDLTRIPVFWKASVFYLQKHSPYKQMFSERLIRMQETGLVARFIQKWTPEKKRCGPRDMTSAIEIEQAKTAFYVLGMGMGLAVISLTLELWVVWVRRRSPCVSANSLKDTVRSGNQ